MSLPDDAPRDDTDAASENHFTLVPTALIKNPDLSDRALRLWLLLDERQGNAAKMRVKSETLMDDLGWSRPTVTRARSELIKAGLLHTKHSGRSLIYWTVNIARNRRRVLKSGAADESNLTQQSPKCVKSDAADESNLTQLQSNTSLGIEKQASNSGDREESPRTTAAAAGSARPASAGSPPLEAAVVRPESADFANTFLKVCHVNLDRNNTVMTTLERARLNGWSPHGLAHAVRDQISNPNAGSGVVVKVMKELAQLLPQHKPDDLNIESRIKVTSKMLGECEAGVHRSTFANIPGVTNTSFDASGIESEMWCSHSERTLNCPQCISERSTYDRDTVKRAHTFLRRHTNADITAEVSHYGDHIEVDWSNGFGLYLERLDNEGNPSHLPTNRYNWHLLIGDAYEITSGLWHWHEPELKQLDQKLSEQLSSNLTVKWNDADIGYTDSLQVTLENRSVTEALSELLPAMPTVMSMLETYVPRQAEPALRYWAQILLDPTQTFAHAYAQRELDQLLETYPELLKASATHE